ncbi:MAG: DUF4406 domain-containing protein [Acidaminococcaceae bacterium]|nr:DUF4406 domain-containing protein [Acidaminococcaceae bacterium]
METRLKWNNREWEILTGDAEAIRDQTVVYLAGPMTGVPDWNRPAFYSAEEFFRQEGALVLNPARLPIGMPGKAYLPICLAMVEQADVIALLPGWESSEGATIETLYATKQGKPMLEIVKAKAE